MQNREEVIEAAMLARMVGSHLSNVDQMTVERSSNSANKINMQNFVAPLVGQQIQKTSFEAEVPADVRKAYEGVNELALQSVPEPINAHAPLVGTPLPAPIQHPQAPLKIKKDNGEVLISRSDVDSIRNSLKNIDKTLAGMLKLLQNSKLSKHE
jgi:hypothetical protein